MIDVAGKLRYNRLSVDLTDFELGRARERLWRGQMSLHHKESKVIVGMRS